MRNGVGSLFSGRKEVSDPFSDAIGYRGPQGSTFCPPHQGETPLPPDVGGGVAPRCSHPLLPEGIGLHRGPIVLRPLPSLAQNTLIVRACRQPASSPSLSRPRQTNSRTQLVHRTPEPVNGALFHPHSSQQQGGPRQWEAKAITSWKIHRAWGAAQLPK